MHGRDRHAQWFDAAVVHHGERQRADADLGQRYLPGRRRAAFPHAGGVGSARGWLGVSGFAAHQFCPVRRAVLVEDDVERAVSDAESLKARLRCARSKVPPSKATVASLGQHCAILLRRNHDIFQSERQIIGLQIQRAAGVAAAGSATPIHTSLRVRRSSDGRARTARACPAWRLSTQSCRWIRSAHSENLPCHVRLPPPGSRAVRTVRRDGRAGSIHPGFRS